MKFSLSTSFARLALFALLAVFLLTVGGRMVAQDGSAAACPTWPVCIPLGAGGWAQMFHRVSAGLSAVLVLALLFEAWRTQRDHRLLLPLTTVAVTLFFAQAFVGAIQVARDFPVYLTVMHSLTAFSL